MKLADIMRQAASVTAPFRDRLTEIDNLHTEGAQVQERNRLLRDQIRMAEINIPVEGKNEAERKAHKDRAVADDPLLRDLYTELRDAEAEASTIARRIARLEKDHALDKREVELVAALVIGHALDAEAHVTLPPANGHKPSPAPLAANRDLF